MQKTELKPSSQARAVRDVLRRVAFVVALAGACVVSAVGQTRAVYTNPALAGDYPDPSVIRVGQDYWATATSSEWAPEFPIMHSRDLVNWRVVGSVFQKRPAWSVGNYWAPEISEDRGRFYIYYTAKKKDGPLCVAVATARRPQGPYTDHGPLICQEVGSIDGFPLRDENGQRYLLWKEDGNSRSVPTPIWAQPLSPDGTRLVGERQELIRNDQPWEKHASLPYGDLVEGPAVVRRGGWFYMFYSGNFCCARECNYMIGVARARKLLGPWEKNPANPIMRGNDTWKCPGHGTIVSDARGRDYLMYHAMDAKDFVYVGRQALLDEVRWGADGWPTINQGRGPSARAASPHGFNERNAEHFFFDDFTALRLQPGWQWPQANEPLMRTERGRGGRLVLSPTAAQAANPLGAVVARITTVGDYDATVLIDTRGMKQGAVAGLAAYGDGENALGAATDGRGNVVLWRREKNEQKVVSTMADAVKTPLVYLRMTADDGRRYRFAVSEDGNRWRNVGGEMDGEYLPPWDRGVRVALTSGGVAGASAKFEWMRIAPSRARRATR
ncbi:MAG TPA: family 43 glycosylhydrolase [Pyrinomonadaceae bacterium]|nr:family 43 glycosylhydrolase [Pyrinomonadaceae bacterium]